MNEQMLTNNLKEMGIKVNSYQTFGKKFQYSFTEQKTNRKVTYQFDTSHDLYTFMKIEGEEFPKEHSFYSEFTQFFQYFMQKNRLYMFSINRALKNMLHHLEKNKVIGSMREWENDPLWTKKKDQYRDYYFLKVDESETKQMFFFRTKVTRVCEKIQNEDPTFEFKAITTSTCTKRVNVDYYYKNDKGDFYISSQNNSYTIGPLVYNDIDSVIKEYLKQIEQKMRLKNLYETPIKHLKTMMGSYKFSDQVIRKMQQALTAKYEKKEIEIRAANYHRSSGVLGCFQTQAIENRKGDITIDWYRIFDHMMMIYKHREEVCVYVGTIEELQEQYEKHIEPKIKESLWNW